MKKNPVNEKKEESPTTDNLESYLRFIRKFADSCRESAAAYPLYVGPGARVWIEDSSDRDEAMEEMTHFVVIGFLVHKHEDPNRFDVVWPITLAGPLDPRQYSDIAVEHANGTVEDMHTARPYRSIADWSWEVRMRREAVCRRARDVRRAAADATKKLAGGK